MKRWEEDYLACLRSGKDPDTCARRCAGMPLTMVMTHIETNPEFLAAWEKILPAGGDGDGLTGTRVLSAQSLEALLYGQCSDEEAAAYFGLDVAEMMERIAGNERLGRVYKFARTGGKAAIRMAQHEKAIAGDATMLTWVGKNVLAQSDKVEHNKGAGFEIGAPVTINQIFLKTLTNEQLESLRDQSLGIGNELVIEGQSVRITETDKTTTIEGERHDLDHAPS